MSRRSKSALVVLSVVAFAVAGSAGPSVAQAGAQSSMQQENAVRSGVVINKKDNKLAVWTKKGREVFELNPQTTLPQRPLLEGSLVVVRETVAGSKVAERVILVDEEIWVESKGTRERAIIGRFEPSVTSPDQMIIRTRDGKEAFVIDPDTFHQPFPAPNQRVALTYRVVASKPPRYVATGLVLLPDTFDSPVQITYQDIPRPEPPAPAAPAPAPKPAPAPEPAPMVTLPQTAGRTPLVVLLGGLLVGLGLAVRYWR